MSIPEFEQKELYILRTILNSLPMGILYCDRQGVLQAINKTYAKYLGISRDDALGKNILEVIAHSPAARVMDSGQAEMADICEISDGRKTRKLIVNRIPIRDEQGNVIGMTAQTIAGTLEELTAIADKFSQLTKQVSIYEQRMKSALSARYDIESIVGESPAIRHSKEQLKLYAKTDSPVLILGPTGTGKELFANALHAASSRSKRPFVSINCAAIPKELFESELFGYAGGAFSGAHKNGKMGQVELADEGTLFLDEIGDIPLAGQAKLLRILEEGTYYRVGSVNPRRLNFRLVAATNRDLKGMMQDGTFREDLYYRISPLILNIPPLNERRSDIPVLIAHMLTQMDRTDIHCSDAALAALSSYDWPGNIRELRNAAINALSVCKNGIIEWRDLPAVVSGRAMGGVTPQASGGLSSLVANNEAKLLADALQENNWNVTRTAKALDISRGTLHEKIKKYMISRQPPAKK